MKMLICGKGGCGKSTVAARFARAQQKRGQRVLLVDADESNIGLYRMLGVAMPQPLLDSLGGKKGLREKTAPGLSLGGPPELFPRGLQVDALPEECVARTDGLRVMSVGKIHHFGEGCACPMGRLFRMLFSALELAENDMVIVDAAAGVEHFGRGLDGQCDQILCVVDPSYESIMMAKRVAELAREANLPVALVLNRTTPEIENELKAALESDGIIGSLPDSRSIFRNNLQGKPLDTDQPEIASVCDALFDTDT
jgi:CO dehydrogenase maturation factor